MVSTIPESLPGIVFRYDYLWTRENADEFVGRAGPCAPNAFSPQSVLVRYRALTELLKCALDNGLIKAQYWR